jgi:hypothetical protein
MRMDELLAWMGWFTLVVRSYFASAGTKAKSSNKRLPPDKS